MKILNDSKGYVNGQVWLTPKEVFDLTDILTYHLDRYDCGPVAIKLRESMKRLSVLMREKDCSVDWHDSSPWILK